MSDIDVDLNSLTNPEQAEVPAGDVVDKLNIIPADGSARGDLVAGQTLMLDQRDTQPQEYVVATLDPDKDNTLQQSVAARAESVRQQAQQVLQATLETDPANFATQVQVEQERLNADESPIKTERAVVESIAEAAPINVDKLIVEEEAFRLAALNDVARLMDSQGTWDKVADFSGFFVPFNLTADLSDLLDTQPGFTNATNIGQFVLDFQALPADRKAEYWPQVVESVLAATGTNILGAEVSDANVIKTAGILINLLNPEGATAQDKERTLDILFGLADVLPVASGVVGKMASHLKATNNMIRKAKKLGDTERAANLTIQAATDETAAKVIGVAQQEAVTNAIPVAQEGWRLEFTPGLAGDVAEKINAFKRQAEGLTRSFIDESALIKEGLLRAPEKKVAIANRIEKLRQSGSDVLTEGVHIDNIRVASQDETGFVLLYDMIKEGRASMSRQARRQAERNIAKLEERIARGGHADIPALEQELVKAKDSLVTAAKTSEERSFRWGLNEATGDFEETAKHAVTGFEYGVSPSAWAYTGTGESTGFLGTFKSASNLADLAAATQSKMAKLVEEANKTVSGVLGIKARKRLVDVEVAGDEFIDPATGLRGRVFSPEELAAGVDTPNGTVRLTSPAELEAYYKHRIVADQFWQLENYAARRRLEITGFDKEVHVGDGPAIAKVLEDAGAARASVLNAKGTHMYSTLKDEAVEITEELVDSVYKDGNAVVRLSQDTQVRYLDGSAEAFEYAIVPRSGIKPLPNKVIHYKQGYVPKINLGVEYVVKERIPTVMRGVNGYNRQVTHRFFASKKDAEAYRAEQVARYREANPNVAAKTADERFEVRADHEQTPMERIHEDAGSSGGLYTGARSSSDIHSGLSGVRTERLSPFHAFQRNAQHVGSLIARSEWRLGEEQRWLNTVDSMGLDATKGFRGTVLDLNTKNGRALDRMRKHILRWNQIPVHDESLFAGTVQHLHDWVLGGVRRTPGLSNKESIKSLLWLKHSNPAAAMKSAAFNLALGVMNPAQLFVQASAATVAVTRYGINSATGRSLNYAFKLAFTDRMKNSTAIARIGNKLDDVDTPLFTELREAWERSGLRESVRQNADLNSADNYGVMALDSLKRLSDANLLLYRTGELANRRISFSAAFLEWRRLNPNAKLTNEIMKKVKADANLSMLELNHANRAMWQGGPDTGVLSNILGVMTQFQQVGAKGIELLIKGEARGGFGMKEKARIMLGQTLLYGAAGVPLANAIVGSMANLYGTKLDKDTQESLNQGVAGIVVVNTFGADSQVATRFAPFGQLPNLISDLIFDDVPLAEKGFGVFGDMYGRAGIALDRLSPMVMSGIKGEPTSKEDLLMGMRAIAEVPSSSRNWVKAWIMHNQHKILDRHGGTIIQDTFNWQTEAMQALGFKTIKESETRITQMSNKDYQDMVTDHADTVVWLYSNYIRSGETDPLAGRGLRAALQVMMESIDNPQLEADVRASVERKISQGTSIRERELKKFFERTIPEEIDAGAKALRNNFFANTIQERPIVQPLDTEE